MGFDDICNTVLVLGLGFPSTVETTTVPFKSDDKINNSTKKPATYDPVVKATAASFEPSLTLGVFGETNYDDDPQQVGTNKVDANKPSTESVDLYRQDSAASSFSNVSVKREREINGNFEDVEVEKVSSRASDEDDDGSNGRKKLRLTKTQSALLEESFKQHSTLNPKQKQELARQLKLRPRQVEVWFQNRRARTKLKQTEVDCEFLKKCCETLTNENRKLQKELQELKAITLAQPLYMQLPAAALTMCPSCERIGGGVGENAAKSPFSMAPKPHHYFNPFTNSSAAC